MISANNSTVFGTSGVQDPNHGIADLPLSTTNRGSTETPQTSVAHGAATSPTGPTMDPGATYLPHMEWDTDGRYVGWNTGGQHMGWDTDGRYIGWETIWGS